MAKLDLKGANVIVTGGSRGIGPHIAQALAAEGAKVALAPRNHAELRVDARRLSESGRVVRAIPADLTSAEERRQLIEAVEQRLGPVDVLVNNAGGDG